MKSYSWSMLKIVLVIFFIFICKSSFSSDCMYSNFWTYLSYFVNKTDETYIVYKSCVPAAKIEEREWQELLRLLPSLDGDLKTNIGTLCDDVLLRDPLGNGCVVKIAPSDPKSDGQTFYIKTGFRASGSCGYNWLMGPYDIQISPVDFLIRDEVKDKSDKKPTDTQIRYCGYQTSILGVNIYPQELQFLARHRSNILDPGKYFVYESEEV
jgi:hypothetical protein